MGSGTWPVLLRSQATKMLSPKESLWSSTDESKKYERKEKKKPSCLQFPLIFFSCFPLSEHVQIQVVTDL